MYSVVLAKSAAKDFERIDARYKRAIKNQLVALQENPNLGKKLKDNLSKFRSIREGSYRIIYKVEKKQVLILIVAISHRQSAYKIK